MIISGNLHIISSYCYIINSSKFINFCDISLTPVLIEIHHWVLVIIRYSICAESHHVWHWTYSWVGENISNLILLNVTKAYEWFISLILIVEFYNVISIDIIEW